MGLSQGGLPQVLRPLRGLWRLSSAVLHGLHGVGIVLLRFPSLPPAGRRARIAWWSRGMLQALGGRLDVQGQFKPGAKLIVANHVSWLDIMAIHACCPEARFVSKSDVQHWPLINRLVASADTLYIEREKRRDALRVVHQMAEALQAGDTVAVFPEGTTAEGPVPLPFHANLLQAAISTGAPVQPVVLRFSDGGGAYSVAAQFVGDTTLAQSLWRLACADGLVVHLRVLEPVSNPHGDRRAWATHLRDRMLAELPPHA